MSVKSIFCIGCNKEVEAQLVLGGVIYKHRHDLNHLKFYMCVICGNYVGTHKNTDIPLGYIPTPNIRKIRSKVHSVIDPIWKKGLISRKELYLKISNFIGYEFHTANIKTKEEADIVLNAIKNINEVER